MAAMQIPAMKGGLTKAQLPSLVVLTIAFTIFVLIRRFFIVVRRFFCSDPAFVVMIRRFLF